jgi:hypothetical protein
MERAQLILELSFNMAISNERVSWFVLLAAVCIRKSFAYVELFVSKSVIG